MEFKDKVRTLASHIKIIETRDDPEFWKKTETETVTRALKDQRLWDSSLSEIEDFCRELQRLVTIHGEPENVVEIGYKSKAIVGQLDEFRVDLEDAKEAVNKELHARALFSLDQSRAENPRYPTFAGDAGQDFVKLKERTEYRFRRNQVAKKNQLKKLRETLKARALRLIPGIPGDIG